MNKKVEKIVHTSTSEVYGDTNKVPISEQTPIISKSPYSATKIAADQLAYSYVFNLWTSREYNSIL